MAWYPLTTREAVKAALAVASTNRADPQIDDAMVAATEAIEGWMHRSFRPELTTHTFPWPPLRTTTPSWVVYLDQHDLIEAHTVVIGGDTITPADYRLEPSSGPPYFQIEANITTIGGFSQGPSWQRSVVITGLFGHSNLERIAGLLTSAPDASATELDISQADKVGVGDILRVGTERMLVTDRSWVSTGTTLASDAGSSMAVNLTLADGSAVRVGEVLLIDSERMLVSDRVGSLVTVRRAWDGSTLAAHTTGATVYANRRLSVDRGALGTTATAHSASAVVYRHIPPPLIERLARAETLVQLQAERAAYASASGTGATEANAAGEAVSRLWDQADRAFRRKGRFR